MRKGQFDPLFIGVLVFLLGMVIASTAMDSISGDSTVTNIATTVSSTGEKVVCSAIGANSKPELTTTQAESVIALVETGGSFTKYSIFVQCYLGGLFGTGSVSCPFIDPDGDRCPVYDCQVGSGTQPACRSYMNICTAGACTETTEGDRNAEFFGYIEDDTNRDGGYLCNNEPWQCFLIFGVLPFAVIYFFIMDILGFASFFSGRTRKIIGLGVAAMATATGGLASVAQQLNEISRIGVGGSFITLIFTLGLFTALIGQFTTAAQQATQARVAKYELTEGFNTMRDVGRRLTGKGP